MQLKQSGDNHRTSRKPPLQAELIASGEIELDIEPYFEQDRLGESLMRIQKSIITLEQALPL